MGRVTKLGSRSDPDVAATAALVGDRSRAAMLMALADGRALPASELAHYAHVSPQTASSHLDRLFKGNLIAVEIQGRHHYYRIRDDRVAQLIERLAVIAPPAPAITPAQRRGAQKLRFARTCYGHLAGALGVAVSQALCDRGMLVEGVDAYRVTDRGKEWFRRIDVDVDALRCSMKRPLTRWCIDWSERRRHLSGVLGVAMTQRFFALSWIVRVRQSRAVRMTERGRAAFVSELGLANEAERP